jgi:putative DNA primase/helicase
MSTAAFLRADDIHARVDWPEVLARLGVGSQFLRYRVIGGRNKGIPGPCPACGGTDRYVFDNRHGRGDFHCRCCGAGDGFALLMRVHGWTFAEARRQVLEATQLQTSSKGVASVGCGARAAAISPAPLPSYRPPARVLAVARGACAVADCPDAVAYLESRGLWPVPVGCALKAHPALEYWHEGQRVGVYPGLVAEVRDVASELVTLHVSYLEGGRKLATHEPRKILSPLLGRDGCAVRLMPPNDVLGIAEGVETALSAAALYSVPVWAALNTSLLAKFEPPAGVNLLHIYADADRAGQEAAGRLMERLQGRVRFELHVPPAPHNDFNDQLAVKTAKESNP